MLISICFYVFFFFSFTYIVGHLRQTNNINNPILSQLYKQNKELFRQKYQKNTIYNYLRTIKKFIIWLQHNKIHYNCLQYINCNIIALYLQYKVTNISIHQLDIVRSSFYWFFDLIGLDSKILKQDPFFNNTKTTLQKLYKKMPDKRIAISILRLKAFSSTYGVNMDTIESCEFNKLVDVLVLQIQSALGARGGELLATEKTRRIFVKDISLKDGIISQLTGKKSCKFINIKLKRRKTDPNDSYHHNQIIGETRNKYFNPAFFYKRYILRRKKLSNEYKSKSNTENNMIMKKIYYQKYLALRLDPNNPAFVFKDGSIYKKDNFNTRVITPLSKQITLQEGEKFTNHSLRISLATNMRIRGYSSDIIKDYIGWTLNNGKHANNAYEGYIRLNTFQKANLLKEIINKPVIIGN